LQRITGPLGSRVSAAVAVLGVLLASGSAASAFDPDQEAANYSKISEREIYITSTPQFQQRLQQQNAQDALDYPQIIATDPERNFASNVCSRRHGECAGDVRFYDWEKDGFGLMRHVLFTARSGATISGTVWATRAGPSVRPGIVITTGSVQAPETLYWGLAAVLAKHGYVVLTYDVQGQGRSDTFGEGPDANEGVPAQEGQPFYDGSEDALDFLLSTQDHPYDPRPSCGNETGGIASDHSAKQDRRVAQGLNTAFNPFGDLVDSQRIGLAGHSLGAAGVSYIGQEDPRVDAIVGWDNLRSPTGAPACPSDPATRVAQEITKPALGMSADYFLVPQPYSSDPDPQSKNAAFGAYQQAGVDSMQVNIRGGTHYEFSFLPGTVTTYPFGTATLRGMDMVAWYTIAWFDRYVKGEPGADSRLLTNRWQDDPLSAQIDPNSPPDPSLYSFYFRSQYDFQTTAGSHVTCVGTETMRAGCADMGPDNCGPGVYSFVADAQTPDVPGAEPDPCGGIEPLRACPFEQIGGRKRDKLRGTPADDLLRGRGGGDVLRGKGGRDCLSGGAGADRLQGGPDSDRIKGGRGPDRLNAKDGDGDTVRCGPGHDRARVDRKDRVRGCELGGR
jgi:dienelactone hydrolase